MGQRMFVAVVPPESVRDDLTDFLEPRSRGALGASALRWIDREQWHITLAFFESVPDHRIDELAERLASAAQRRTPFDVALAGAGAFPSAARASVLWLGVTTGHIVDSGTLDALPSLATNARAAGSVVGAAPDGKSFHPHLTVAQECEKAADLGYGYIELSPRADFHEWHHYPKVDDAEIARVKKAMKATGVKIETFNPVFNWASPNEQERQAQVRNWRRLLEIAEELEVPMIATEFSGDPTQPLASEHQFYLSLIHISEPTRPY